MTYSITRRGVLRILAILGAFGLTRPICALAKPCESIQLSPLASRLASYFSCKESAAQVGREYLRCVPGEVDVSRLIDLICSFQEERRAELADADKAKLRGLLLLQQRQDFEKGRIVHVRGWILSETEARLCALAGLI